MSYQQQVIVRRRVNWWCIVSIMLRNDHWLPRDQSSCVLVPTVGGLSKGGRDLINCSRMIEEARWWEWLVSDTAVSWYSSTSEYPEMAWAKDWNCVYRQALETCHPIQMPRIINDFTEFVCLFHLAPDIAAVKCATEHGYNRKWVEAAHREDEETLQE